jgi:hypothetical protein
MLRLFILNIKHFQTKQDSEIHKTMQTFNLIQISFSYNVYRVNRDHITQFNFDASKSTELVM